MIVDVKNAGFRLVHGSDFLQVVQRNRISRVARSLLAGSNRLSEIFIDGFGTKQALLAPPLQIVERVSNTHVRNGRWCALAGHSPMMKTPDR